MNYEYTNLEADERQYDDYDLSEINTVKACYVKSKTPIDNGNPYIEALPRPRDTVDEVYNVYTKPLSGYNYSDIINWSKYDKQAYITSLRSIRYMLPFHIQLEKHFNFALLSSYRERKSMLCNNKVIIKNDIEEHVDARLLGRNGAASNAGVTLLGYSGCGKSASVEILLSNYPQVIEHSSKEMPRFTQITYLVVVCPTCSNFSALYSSIGNEIDIALNNTTPVYKQMIDKQKNLGAKADIVCELIQLFGIGCIIFDEIQFIDFKGQKENTFESLLTIVNRTKVALMVVGTEDAYEKMFPNLRMARRTGTLIQASKYCENTKYFASIVKDLMQYQLFDTHVEATSDIIKAFYDVSKGIIAQLINVYIFMHINYIEANTKPEINSEYIYKIANLYFSNTMKILNDMSNPDSQLLLMDNLQETKEEIERILANADANKATDYFLEMNNSITQKDKFHIRNNVIRNVQNTLKIANPKAVYNPATIEKAVDYVMGLKKHINKTEEELTQVAYERLLKGKSDKRPNVKKMSDAPKIDYNKIRESLKENE